ncbi:MAG: sulfite exporter TauE/SafE family protein [Bacteroidota bacterium]
MPELTITQYLIAFFCAYIFGVAKAGIKGIGIVAIPLMAIVFGGKASTGIVLPILIMADCFAVWYYNQHARWKDLRPMLPWLFIGVLLGVWVGKDLPEEQFRIAMGSIILFCVGILFIWDRKKDKTVPDWWWFSILMGLVSGFTTMVGNLAGAFVTLYFLSLRLPKTAFIATTAWLFFIVNWFKVPFHIWVWETITWETFKLNLLLIPGILAGLLTGVYVVKRIKEWYYRQLILWLTAIGAILIFFS